MKNFTSRSISYFSKSLFSLLLFCLAITVSAQTEDFESETIGSTNFTVDGVLFKMTGDFRVAEFTNFSCGGTNAGLNKYIDTGYQDGSPSSGIFATIAPSTSCASFQLNTGVNAQWGWTGINNGENHTNGTVRFTGTTTSQSTLTEDILFTTTNETELVPFTFSNNIWGGVDLVSLQFEIVNASCDYIAFDEIQFADISGQYVIFTEDFEDHGNTANGGTGRYTSTNDFMDSGTDDDYWGRIRASDNQYFLTNTGSGFSIHSNVEYTGQHGDFFYAGEDQDDIGGTIGSPDENDEKQITFSDINISGGSNLKFSGLFAKGEDSSCGSSKYDHDDFVKVYYSIDGGPEIEALCFNADLECNIPDDITNEPLYHDPNCDGDGGEGTLLSAVFQSFSFDIAGTGSSLNLRIVSHMDLGDEEIAFDFFQVCSSTEVIACTATATFNAPSNLCIDAGVQSGLGGGIPTGGVYSGAGINDNGNGMTYSFNPANAGAGTHQITYTYNEGMGCPDVIANDNIEVYALPNLSFSPPSSFCLDAGIQTGLGDGAPAGGTYSGVGVTDNGDGLTYSFDPLAVGAGTHSVSYQYTDNNLCSASISNTVQVFSLPTVSLTPPPFLCINDGPQFSLVGGSPNGGVYSGSGVTDDGNGMTYSIDPSVAGVGTHAVTYTYTDINNCSASSSETLEVYDLPIVTLDLPDTLYMTQAMPQLGVGGGSPSGGIYTSDFPTEMSDDGNGMTFSFSDQIFINGNITIFYSYTDVNGCENIASKVVHISETPVGLDNLSKINLEIFPNPTNGVINLIGEPIDRIEVIELNGKVLRVETIPSNTLDLSDFPSGIYFLRIKVVDEVLTTRVIKE